VFILGGLASDGPVHTLGRVPGRQDAGGTRRWQPAWANGRLASGVVMEQFRTPVTIISCE